MLTMALMVVRKGRGREGAPVVMNGYPEVSVEDSSPAANPRLSEGPAGGGGEANLRIGGIKL